MRTPHGCPEPVLQRSVTPIRLVDVYEFGVTQNIVELLYIMLAERPPEASISHKHMPTLEQHRQFVTSRPYEAWYFIEAATAPIGIVGSIYLTRAREVGIFIRPGRQGNGFGEAAIRELIRLHPGRLLANVAPTNPRSIVFFQRLGAKHIQNTYELT